MLLKSPDDFDFDITRAINRPAATTEYDTAERPQPEGALSDEKTPSDEKGAQATVKTTEPSDDESTTEDDLNPEGLKRAFRFAAWASLALVRGFFPDYQDGKMLTAVAISSSSSSSPSPCRYSSRRRSSACAGSPHGSALV